MQAFARDWIANWNRRDVEAVLGHFTDDPVFISPLAATITGEREVRGKEALRAYWKRASAQSTSLRFDLIEAICDVPAQTLVVFYRAEKDGAARTAVEIMRFEDGRQVSGEALYGAAL
ncbi:nuclear transport factor 2 family protein [Sphingomonas sp. 36D10-4-7]|uniref:Nuclear transport factor 2 family protein n=2 Tax=Sphingomonas corticis TaxID=2722791 RepID=A0ABX1CWD1_9SPHN|nr:nuclear transport factor 2 family protein [Sphingomonas corticis]NJR80285.1 nuclear transport factor 2 family protein [Sphingomonas corticis]